MYRYVPKSQRNKKMGWINGSVGAVMVVLLIVGAVTRIYMLLYINCAIFVVMVFINIVIYSDDRKAKEKASLEKTMKRYKIIKSGGSFAFSEYEDDQQASNEDDLDAVITKLVEAKEPALIMVDEFDDEVLAQKCAICKLPTNVIEGKIIQCSKCHALFHLKHLKQWLATNSDCPVCEEQLK